MEYEMRLREAVNAYLNCTDKKRAYIDLDPDDVITMFAHDYCVVRNDLQMSIHRERLQDAIYWKKQLASK